MYRKLWPSEGGLFLTSIFVYRENGIAISSAQWFSTMKDGGLLEEFLRIGVIVCAIHYNLVSWVVSK